MPTDWLFFWLTRPGGLALIGVAVALPFLIWRAMLGRAFSEIGIKPLAYAYLWAAIGLALMSFAGSYFEFSGRVASGILPETQRWSIVPGWSIYIAVLSLIFVLPLLGLVGVPLAAALLKRGHLTPLKIASCVLVVSLTLTVLGSAFPGNEWHRTHRFESFVMGLKGILPGMIFIALPFMLAIYLTSRQYRLRP